MTDREELRLITSESELRVGMLLQVKPCRCGGTHRVLVMGLGGVGPCSCGEDSLRVVLDHYTHSDARTTSSCLRMAIRWGIIYEVRSRRDDEDEQRKQHDLDLKLAADLARARPAVVVRRERAR